MRLYRIILLETLIFLCALIGVASVAGEESSSSNTVISTDTPTSTPIPTTVLTPVPAPVTAPAPVQVATPIETPHSLPSLSSVSQPPDNSARTEPLVASPTSESGQDLLEVIPAGAHPSVTMGNEVHQESPTPTLSDQPDSSEGTSLVSLSAPVPMDEMATQAVATLAVSGTSAETTAPTTSETTVPITSVTTATATATITSVPTENGTPTETISPTPTVTGNCTPNVTVTITPVVTITTTATATATPTYYHPPLSSLPMSLSIADASVSGDAEPGETGDITLTLANLAPSSRTDSTLVLVPANMQARLSGQETVQLERTGYNWLSDTLRYPHSGSYEGVYQVTFPIPIPADQGTYQYAYYPKQTITNWYTGEQEMVAAGSVLQFTLQVSPDDTVHVTTT